MHQCCIVKIQTMRGSPYIKRNEAECKHFEFRLKYAQSFLDELINCQRTWMYLEPIFSSEDIIRQVDQSLQAMTPSNTLQHAS